jgi:DNA polymerase-3 subunit gamma/tau
LQHICSAEKITFDPSALAQLAQAADGSARDALSLLDQAIAYCPEGITADDTRRMLGNVGEDYIFNLLHALADQDGKKLLAEIATLAEQAPDFNQVLENMLSLLHNIALTQIAASTENISTLAARFSAADVQLYYQIALLGRRDLPLAASPVQGFEMVMLRMLAFKPVTPETLAPTKDKHTDAATAKIKTPAANPTPPAKIITPALPATNIPAMELKSQQPGGNATENTSSSLQEWTTLLHKLNLSGLSQVLASHCVLKNMTADSVELALSQKHETLFNKQLITRLEEALSQHLNTKINLKIILTTDDLHTSAKQQAQTKKDQHASAVDAITTDNHVQKIMDVFGATLDVNSVKAIDPAT